MGIFYWLKRLQQRSFERANETLNVGVCMRAFPPWTLGQLQRRNLPDARSISVLRVVDRSSISKPKPKQRLSLSDYVVHARK